MQDPHLFDNVRDSDNIFDAFGYDGPAAGGSGAEWDGNATGGPQDSSYNPDESSR